MLLATLGQRGRFTKDVHIPVVHAATMAGATSLDVHPKTKKLFPTLFVPFLFAPAGVPTGLLYESMFGGRRGELSEGKIVNDIAWRGK